MQEIWSREAGMSDKKMPTGLSERKESRLFIIYVRCRTDNREDWV